MWMYAVATVLAVDAVFDDDLPAPLLGELGDRDRAVGGGEDRGAVRGGEIAAGVEGLLLAGDRVRARPDTGSWRPGALRQREHHPRRLRRTAHRLWGEAAGPGSVPERASRMSSATGS
jgi:hypothetical protein